MKSAKLVCPDEPGLIDRLEGRTLCVRVVAPEKIADAAKRARRTNKLFCVICDCSAPLEDIAIEDGWRGIPIALVAPSVGKFRRLAKKLRALRALNLRVFLPCDRISLIGARLLASVGVPVCVGAAGGNFAYGRRAPFGRTEGNCGITRVQV